MSSEGQSDPRRRSRSIRREVGGTRMFCLGPTLISPRRPGPYQEPEKWVNTISSRFRAIGRRFAKSVSCAGEAVTLRRRGRFLGPRFARRLWPGSIRPDRRPRSPPRRVRLGRRASAPALSGLRRPRRRGVSSSDEARLPASCVRRQRTAASARRALPGGIGTLGRSSIDKRILVAVQNRRADRQARALRAR